MNVKDVIIFVGVALAAYMMLSRRRGAPVSTAGATEIQNTALPGQTGYGWRYFSNGTAIAPDGTYYYKGTAVYSASYDGVSVGTNYSNLI